MKAMLLLGLRLLVVSSAALALDPRLPLYQASGTHYEVGKQIGEQARERVQPYLKAYPSLAKLKAYAKTAAGAANIKTLIAVNSAAFPELFEEMRGLAHGAAVDYNDVIYMNMRHELNALIKTSQNVTDADAHSINECSDVLLGGRGFGHNEDGWIDLHRYAFLVNASFTNSSTSSGYLAFHYPASLAGHAFGFNRHGLAFSMNALSPNLSVGANADGLAIYLLCRSMVDAKNISQAVDRAQPMHQKIAYGGSWNVGSVHNRRVVNIEVGPGVGQVTTKECSDDNVVFHFNEYTHSPTVEQYMSNSTNHRRARSVVINATKPIVAVGDAVNILGDTGDKRYAPPARPAARCCHHRGWRTRADGAPAACTLS